MTEEAVSLCAFLTCYAEKILSSGSTTARCEKTLSRSAKAYGAEIEISILPRTVSVTLRDEGRANIVTHTKTIKALTLNFHHIHLLSDLSRSIQERGISLTEAEEEFRRIVSKPRMPM